MRAIIHYLLIYAFSITSVLAQITSEEVLINNMEIQLPGTLTFSAKNQPLIIWVHGSGNVDRNGNQAGVNVNANYIKQFRDAVNTERIAFFSYDKRTSNPKNANFLKETLFTDFVLDVKEVIHHFKNDKRFTKIILIGHSQGSLVAMQALENVDKYISIAGAGETVDNTIVKQITKRNADLGETAKNHFKELSETGTIKNINPMLATFFAPQNQAFFKSWMSANPTKILKSVKIPILIINGDKDIQVMIEDAENLHKANPASKLVLIENMNHVLKDIQKEEDNLKSYYAANYPLSKKLVETVVSFVKK